jgi:methionyl-tRNA formyltransferase
MISAVFMGTPEAAVPSLNALPEVASVDLVVTRPDRPRGRSRRLQPPPVKEAANRLGLQVAQPENAAALAELMERRSFDVGIVVAFGMILRPKVLAVPRQGFLNVHFSLLPRWRGAAPVERSIMAGDSETGVTIMAMDEGLDTGPIISQLSTPIGPHETGGELRERLAGMGAELLIDTLPAWITGELATTPQEEAKAVYAARIEPEDRLITPDMAVDRACNRVRALAPAPGARLSVDGELHKLLQCRTSAIRIAPGQWAVAESRPVVGLADGAIEIEQIQPPGKREMPGEAWLRGRDLPSPRP